MLTCSENCVISYNAAADQKRAFLITDTKVLVVALSAQDKSELLQQLNQALKEQLTGINKSQISKTKS